MIIVAMLLFSMVYIVLGALLGVEETRLIKEFGLQRHTRWYRIVELAAGCGLLHLVVSLYAPFVAEGAVPVEVFKASAFGGFFYIVAWVFFGLHPPTGRAEGPLLPDALEADQRVRDENERERGWFHGCQRAVFVSLPTSLLIWFLQGFTCDGSPGWGDVVRAGESVVEALARWIAAVA